MILITGIPGWLGNRLAEIILNGLEKHPELPLPAPHEKIRFLCLPQVDVSFLMNFSGRVEIIRGDITNKESLRDFFKDSEDSTLYHLAGVIHPYKGVKQFYHVNVDGTKNVLDMAREYKVKKIIVMSSNSQSGCNPNITHRFTEESPYNPYQNYGKSKMIMEQITKKYYNLYDMDVTIIRTCWFYGPHQPERQTLLFRMIKEGKVPLVGNGENVRSLSYVDNICQGMILAANRTISKGKTYWLADENSYTMSEIINTIEDVLRKDFNFSVTHKRMKLPNIVSEIAFFVDYLLQSLGIYQQKIHVLSEMNKNIACSIDLAKKELAYSPDISLREGMKISIQWCLDNGYRI